MATSLALRPGAAAHTLADVALVEVLVHEARRQLDCATTAGLGAPGDETDATLDETIDAIERLTAQIGLVTHLIGLIQDLEERPDVPRRPDPHEDRMPELLDLLDAGDAAAVAVIEQGARRVARGLGWGRP